MPLYLKMSENINETTGSGHDFFQPFCPIFMKLGMKLTWHETS